MSKRSFMTLAVMLALGSLLGACYPNPEPPGLTPIPTLSGSAPLTPVAAVTGAPTEAGAVAEAQPTSSVGAGPTPINAAAAPSGGSAAGGNATPAAGGGAAAKATAAPGGGGATGNAQQGQQLFAANCSPCHGQGGVGGGVGPKLVGNAFVQKGPDQAIHDTIANGRPGTAMPAWSQAKGGSLSEQQIADLVAYVKSLQK